MQLVDFVDAILKLSHFVNTNDMILWKIDLKGAFNLIFFEAKRAGLFSMSLNQFITIISLVGNFGWTGTPFAFGVISQSLLFGIRKRLRGNVEICTDDLCGVSHRNDVDHDIAIVREVIIKLLGPFAINEKKTVVARVADIVGWSINLDTQLVTMAKHNLLRTLYDFIQVKHGQHISIKYLQKLASYSSRYSTICRYMKPFSSYLYDAASGYHNVETRVMVSAELLVVTDLWTMMIILTVIQPARFQRSLASFAAVEPTIIPNFDASLTGLGIILYRIISLVDSRGTRQVIGQEVFAVVGYSTPFVLSSQSAFQNAMEFIAVVTFIGLLVSLGYRNAALSLLGDSITALNWSHKERFPSMNSKAAAIQYIQLMSDPGVNIVITDTQYINTLLNTHCDELSRNISSPLDLGYDSSVIYDINSNPTLSQWIKMMNPANPIQLEFLQSHWTDSDILIQSLLSDTGGWNLR
jgi:hypothetical protein